jgi:chromate transporter
MRQNKKISRALFGVNAAVVGLLLAALYSPLWTSAIKRPIDLLCFMVLLFILMVGRLPPVLVVLLGIIGSIALAHLGWF